MLLCCVVSINDHCSLAVYAYDCSLIAVFIFMDKCIAGRSFIRRAMNSLTPSTAQTVNGWLLWQGIGYRRCLSRTGSPRQYGRRWILAGGGCLPKSETAKLALDAASLNILVTSSDHLLSAGAAINDANRLKGRSSKYSLRIFTALGRTCIVLKVYQRFSGTKVGTKINQTLRRLSATTLLVP